MHLDGQNINLKFEVLQGNGLRVRCQRKIFLYSYHKSYLYTVYTRCIHRQATRQWRVTFPISISLGFTSFFLPIFPLSSSIALSLPTALSSFAKEKKPCETIWATTTSRLPSGLLLLKVSLFACLLNSFEIYWKDRKSTRLNSSHAQ